MHNGNPVQMAGLAQKMAKMLFLDCPPNYHCGGPAYAALESMDTILALMGIGIAMIQKRGNDSTEAFQSEVLNNAIEGPGIYNTYIQHKSQILAGALHAMVCDIRTLDTRECREVTENALLSLLQWYFHKTGADLKDFWVKLEAMTHDELIQLEKGFTQKGA